MTREDMEQVESIQSAQDALRLLKEWLPPGVGENNEGGILVVLRRVKEIGYLNGKQYEADRIRGILGI